MQDKGLERYFFEGNWGNDALVCLFVCTDTLPTLDDLFSREREKQSGTYFITESTYFMKN